MILRGPDLKRRSILKRFLHRAEYGMLVLLSAVFRALPAGWVYAAGRFLGGVAYHAVRVRRNVVEENLRASLGAEKDERELVRIARESYANIALTFIEMLLFPDMADRVSYKHPDLCFYKSRGPLMVDMSEAHVIEDAYARGKGIVFVGCHFGSWEMSGACVGALGYPVTVVAKIQANPHVDAWVNRYRENLHMRIIRPGAPVKHIVRAIRNGEIVGLISDQDAGARGVFVDFFGRKASTPRGAAELAIRFHTPVLIGMTARTGNGRYRSMYREVEVRADDTVETLTRRYTGVIEGIIRQYPEQYFWMHRRWKSRPPGARMEDE